MTSDALRPAARRGKRPTPADIQAAAALFAAPEAAFCTVETLAARLGVCRRTVHRWFHRDDFWRAYRAAIRRQ